MTILLLVESLTLDIVMELLLGSVLDDDPMSLKLPSPVLPSVDILVYGDFIRRFLSLVSDASMDIVSSELLLANLKLLNSSVFVSTTSLFRSASFVLIVFLSYIGSDDDVPL